MKINKFYSCLVLLLGLSVLSGCGGGGGGGGEGGIPNGYDGITTPVAIDADNAPLLADSTLGYNDPSEFMLFRSTGGDLSDVGKPAGVARAQSIAERAAALLRSAGESATFQGDYSGTATITSEDTGYSFKGTVTFTNYSDSADVDPVSGTVTISGTNGETNTAYTSHIEASISEDFSAGPVSMSGSFRIDLAVNKYSFSQKVTTTMVSMLYEDASTGLKVAYTNMVFASEWDSTAGVLLTKLDGRMYIGNLGYIDIDTVVPFVADGFGNQGEVLISGADNSSVRLVFEGSTITALLETGDDELYDEGIWLL